MKVNETNCDEDKLPEMTMDCENEMEVIKFSDQKCQHWKWPADFQCCLIKKVDSFNREELLLKP